MEKMETNNTDGVSGYLLLEEQWQQALVYAVGDKLGANQQSLITSYLLGQLPLHELKQKLNEEEILFINKIAEDRGYNLML